jgi:hypothetical protein
MTAHTLHSTREGSLSRFLRENGLSLTLGALFLAFLLGQTLTGHRHYNEEQIQHGGSPVPLSTYLTTGDFIEATAENWESEFLQMAAYVLFTVFLYQRGSAESKKIGTPEAVDRDPRRARNRQDAPWPVRRGGWVLTLYSHSLTLAFFLLFLISFVLHAIGGTLAQNEEQLAHGDRALSVFEYMQSSRFWFESFQNWQSEFLAIGMMVVLSIFLRQRGSPESKPVDASHRQTGAE